MINFELEVEKRKDAILKDLSDWIKIGSVYDETTKSEEHPFGEGVSKALAFILDKAKEDGFETLNVDNYAGHIDFGDGDQTMGILGHVDVVPVGSGWDLDPFSGAIEDGVIYGRGTQDDKGPMLAAYYGMKILKDLGVTPSKKVRMILGGNEESGWECVKYYFARHPKPDFGFTPDSDFPLIYAEKAIGNLKVKGQYEDEFVESIIGGTVANSVIDTCEAILNTDSPKFKVYLDEFLSEFPEIQAEYNVDTKTTIKFIGKASHGAQPEKGINAGVYMLRFLSRHTTNEMVSKAYEMFKTYDGKGVGIDFVGDQMGHLTMNLGLVSYVNNEFSYTINVRYPNEITFDLKEKMTETINDERYEVELLSVQPGIHLPLDSHLVKTLHNVYIEHTGDTVTQPKVIGGGTFARAAENIVAFGMLFPHTKDAMHQKNECVPVEDLLKATAIYCHAIYELVK